MISFPSIHELIRLNSAFFHVLRHGSGWHPGIPLRLHGTVPRSRPNIRPAYRVEPAESGYGFNFILHIMEAVSNTKVGLPNSSGRLALSGGCLFSAGRREPGPPVGSAPLIQPPRGPAQPPGCSLHRRAQGGLDRRDNACSLETRAPIQKLIRLNFISCSTANHVSRCCLSAQSHSFPALFLNTTSRSTAAFFSISSLM